MTTMLKIVGDRGSPWVIPRYTLKGGEITTPGLLHYSEPVPVLLEKTDLPRAHRVYRKDIDTPVPFQGVL